MIWDILSFFLISVCLPIIFILLRKIKLLGKEKEELAKRNKELDSRVLPLELESIQYKLNPHLFKNALNSIQSHAYQTYYSLEKLANVLDYVLYESNKQMVTLKEEVEFVLNFIEVNRLKINPLFDLRIKNNIKKESVFYQKKLIAPLISIDLIENAFKHTDFRAPDSFISIVFDLKDNAYVLSVSNKAGIQRNTKKEKGGFGQENFKKRLSIIYKEHYQYDYFFEGEVYMAQLKIDLEGYEAKMFTVG